MNGVGKQSKQRNIKTSNSKVNGRFFVSLSGKKFFKKQSRALSSEIDKCGFSLSKDHSIVLDRLYSPKDFSRIKQKNEKKAQNVEIKCCTPKSSSTRKLTLSSKKTDLKIPTLKREASNNKITIKRQNPNSPPVKLEKKISPKVSANKFFPINDRELKIIKEFPQKKPKQKWLY